MGKLGTVTFTGNSGAKYGFNVYSLDTDFKEIGAVYFFTKRVKKENGKFTHTKHIYVGQTEDLSERFDNHHAMPCIKRHGTNCICVHSESSESKRRQIEDDIIAAYTPTCNG
jgi:hypothetical protein